MEEEKEEGDEMEEGGGAAAEDHLSSLPDSILVEILSFVPTRLAVRTSIISSRWRYLWRSLPVLSFSDSDSDSDADESTSNSLADMVEAALNLRDSSVPLRDFRLRSSYSHVPPRRLSSWLRSSPSLLYLDLSLPHGIDSPLPFPSLRHLSICCKFLDVRAVFTLCLTHLHTLIIHSADLLNAANEKALEDLISACPSLTDLTLDSCYLSSINIVAPALEHLRFHHVDYNDVAVTVRAPKLVLLDHHCEDMERFSLLGGMPDLVDASFDFGAYTRDCNKELVLEALRGLSNARTLTFHDFMVMFPPYNRSAPENLPVFHNLRDLSLIYPLRRDEYIFSIRCLLEHMPKLELLRIDEALLSQSLSPSPEDQDHLMTITKTFPPYHLSRLSDVELDKHVNKSGWQCDRWKFFFYDTPVESKKSQDLC